MERCKVKVLLILAVTLNLLALLFLTSCGMFAGSIDLGFIKIPVIIVFAVIIFYILYRRNNRGK
jgi:hypothetical protein